MFEIRCENCQADGEPCIDCMACQKYLQCKNCQDKEKINYYCIDCLKYNHENGFKLCTSKLILKKNINKNKYHNTLQKFRYNIYRYSSKNYLEMMKYAHENGYSLNIFNFCDCLIYDCDDVLYNSEFIEECICFGIIHENNICPYKDYFFLERGSMNDPLLYDKCEYDITCRYIECLKYAYENGYEDEEHFKNVLYKDGTRYEEMDMLRERRRADDDKDMRVIINDIMKTCVCINGKYIYKYDVFLPPYEKCYHKDDTYGDGIISPLYKYSAIKMYPLLKTYEDIKDNSEGYNFDDDCYNIDDKDFFIRVIRDPDERKRFIKKLKGINTDECDDEGDDNI